MPGRPRKLSEPKQLEICALIHAGCTLAAAATYVGCSVLTIQREARRNDEFRKKLCMARYTIELSPVSTLRNAATDDWRAAAWLLERTQPQHYALRAANSFSPEEIAELLDRVCVIIRQETRNAQLSARIKRRVLALAHSKVAHRNTNPFQPQLSDARNPADAEPQSASTTAAQRDLDTPANSVSIETPSESIASPSEYDQNATEKKPILTCAADIPPRNSRPFAPAYASK